MLVNAQRAAERGELEQYERASGRSRALMAAPAILRERMTFPYLGGMSFMGQLFRAGGFALVNRVYEHPPTTTEQILHVDKYLAGEDAVLVQSRRACPRDSGRSAAGAWASCSCASRSRSASRKPLRRVGSVRLGRRFLHDRGLAARRAGALVRQRLGQRKRSSGVRERGSGLRRAVGTRRSRSAGGFAPPTLVARSGARVAITRGVHPSWSRQALKPLCSRYPFAVYARARPVRADPGSAAARSRRRCSADVLVAGCVRQRKTGDRGPASAGVRGAARAGLILSHDSRRAPALAAIELSELIDDA